MVRCKKPDRDFPELICGYPLPCPWHTLVIDTTKEPPTITIPATIEKPIKKKNLKRLKKIAKALKG